MCLKIIPFYLVDDSLCICQHLLEQINKSLNSCQKLKGIYIKTLQFKYQLKLCKSLLKIANNIANEDLKRNYENVLCNRKKLAQRLDLLLFFISFVFIVVTPIQMFGHYLLEATSNLSAKCECKIG